MLSQRLEKAKGSSLTFQINTFSKDEKVHKGLSRKQVWQGGAAPGPAGLSQPRAAWQILLLVQSKGQQGEKWGLLSQIFSL